MGLACMVDRVCMSGGKGAYVWQIGRACMRARLCLYGNWGVYVW